MKAITLVIFVLLCYKGFCQETETANIHTVFYVSKSMKPEVDLSAAHFNGKSWEIAKRNIKDLRPAISGANCGGYTLLSFSIYGKANGKLVYNDFDLLSKSAQVGTKIFLDDIKFKNSDGKIIKCESMSINIVKD